MTMSKVEFSNEVWENVNDFVYLNVGHVAMKNIFSCFCLVTDIYYLQCHELMIV